MEIKDFHYMQNAEGKTCLFYGDLSEIADELDGYTTEIPQDQWTGEMWSEFAGSVLEDANRHSFVSFPSMYLDALTKHDVADDMKKLCMELLAKLFYELL